MTQGDPQAMKAAILEAVNNQIEAGTPSEVALTLARLENEEYSHEEAIKLIGCAFSSQIFAVMKEGKRYDEVQYIKDLKALPKMPWDE